jgi:CheY-like chemotaxis protein
MPNVLIVEDNLDSADVLERFLLKHGYTVNAVPNGREALVALTSEAPPDVILLDLRMPEMDGLQFLEVVRGYLRWTDLPVIIVTAYADEGLAERAAKLGVERVFHKAALDLQELREAIERVTPANGNAPAGGR